MGKHQTQIGLESIENENWQGKTLLDIGCGSGKLSLQIYQTTQPEKYIGIDLSPDKIEMARNLFSENQINNAEFYVSDSANLQNIPDNSVDVIFCNIAFQQFKDKLGALKEVYRVLKPKGKAIINTIEEKSDVHRIMETIAQVEPGKGNKVTKEEFDQLAEVAAFTKVTSRSFSHTLYFPTVDELLDNYQRFEVIFPKLSSLPKEQLDQLWEKLKEELKQKESGQGFEETWKILSANLQK